MKKCLYVFVAILFLSGSAYPRSAAAKRAFERQTGYRNGRPGYVVDHIIPLACGGADVPSNMQWETVAEGKGKDKWERNGCKHSNVSRNSSSGAPESKREIPEGQPTGTTTATGKEIREGPRGGHFHYSVSGKKVYERKRK